MFSVLLPSPFGEVLGGEFEMQRLYPTLIFCSTFVSRQKWNRVPKKTNLLKNRNFNFPMTSGEQYKN
jgi:hypothetical protein